MSMSSADYATIAAHTQGVDIIARAMEAKWGVDRLPLLVSSELRAKFERQRVKHYAALEAAYDAPIVTRDILDAVMTTSAAMERGWQALDLQAAQDGATALSPEVWEVGLADGTIAALTRSGAEACQLTQSGRYLTVYTLDEIANLIEAIPKALARAKVEFPGSKIVPSKKTDRSWVKDGDAIPF